jgi:hypothetical protein
MLMNEKIIPVTTTKKDPEGFENLQGLSYLIKIGSIFGD